MVCGDFPHTPDPVARPGNGRLSARHPPHFTDTCALGEEAAARCVSSRRVKLSHLTHPLSSLSHSLIFTFAYTSFPATSIMSRIAVPRLLRAASIPAQRRGFASTARRLDTYGFIGLGQMVRLTRRWDVTHGPGLLRVLKREAG